MLKSWTDSPSQSFFATTPPGLEDLCAEELRQKGASAVDESTVIKHHGGIEFSAQTSGLPTLIRQLKIPTHLLWRLGSFRVRDFPKLYTKVKAMPWAKLIPTSELDYKVSATNSRLIHTRRLEKTLRDGIEASLKAWGPKKDLIEKFSAHPKNSWPTLYARIENDILTLSLDLAGENLFKRGQKKHIGSAPLRENLASACLLTAYQDLASRLPKARDLLLWDPFCGSGTMILEAYGQQLAVTTRDFALDLFEPYHVSNSPSDSAFLFASYLASDRDEQMIKAVKENARSLGLEEKKLLEVKMQNIENATPPTQDFVIVTNPPYGERIKNTEGLGALYERLSTFKHCQGAYVLVPHDLAPKKGNLLLKFSHGGLSVGVYRIGL